MPEQLRITGRRRVLEGDREVFVGTTPARSETVFVRFRSREGKYQFFAISTEAADVLAELILLRDVDPAAEGEMEWRPVEGDPHGGHEVVDAT